MLVSADAMTDKAYVARAKTPPRRATLPGGLSPSRRPARTPSAASANSSRPGLRNRAVLFVLAGPQQGSVFQLHGTSTWIGRGSQVDVSLDDDAVSIRHFHVTRRSDGIYVQDGGSRNGTFLNAERLELPQRLLDGDHLCIGNTILKFSMLDELEEHALMQLFELTIHDPLTRTFNRRYLATHLSTELAFAARQNLPLSLLLVDIDHFKQVNDKYGRAVGDVVLKLVATTISRMLRPYDVVCRYGGEEFVIVARDASLRNAEILAERIRHQIEAMHFEVDAASASVTVSIGVTTVAPNLIGVDPETILEAVDQAMYDAKQAGRNRVKVGREPMASTRGLRAQALALHTSPPRPSDESFADAGGEPDCRPPALPRFD